MDSFRSHTTGDKPEQHDNVSETECDPDYQEYLVGAEVAIFEAVVHRTWNVKITI